MEGDTEEYLEKGNSILTKKCVQHLDSEKERKINR